MSAPSPAVPSAATVSTVKEKAKLLSERSEPKPDDAFYAFTTLPLRRQEVQTRIRLALPPTLALMGRRLTFQRRLVTLWAWLMLFPNCGPLPQIAQICAMTAPDRLSA